MLLSRATRHSAPWMTGALWILTAAMTGCGGDDPIDPDPGALALSEQSIIILHEGEGEDPPARTVQVTHVDGGPVSDLDITIQTGIFAPDWLSASLSRETTPATLTISASAASLAPGSHDGAVIVQSPNATNTSQFVAVTLRVPHFQGYTEEFPGYSDHAPNYLLGHRQLIVNGGLASVNFLVKTTPTAGTQVKVGVYTDVSGNPGSLIASAPATAVTIGRNQIPLTAAHNLDAYYWIMLTFSHGVDLGMATDTPETFKHIAHTFADPLPEAFPSTHETYTGQAVNVFVKVY